MCELVGLQVISLKRVRIGKITPRELPEGKWRVLEDPESFWRKGLRFLNILVKSKAHV